MSRSRDEIRAALLSRLSSPVWEAVQNSTIGRELLAFGAEVIATADDTVESIRHSFDWRVANKRDLISMSHTLGIAPSFVREATITVKINPSTTQYYVPYSLKFSAGNATYYNTDYCSSADEIVLRQGVVHSVKTENKNYISWDLPTTVEEKAVEDFSFLGSINGGYHSVNCVNGSQYVFGEGGVIIPQIDYLSYRDDSVYYEPYLLYDGQLAFILHGVSSVQLIYLEATNNDVTTNGTLTFNGTTIPEESYDVKSYNTASLDSIEAARTAFRGFYTERTGICSEQQIRDYVNSFPQVRDCRVVSSGVSVNVWIKPAVSEIEVGSETNYQEIKYALSTRGMVGVNYEVTPGAMLAFQVVCSCPAVYRSEVEEIIKTHCEYSLLDYNSPVDTAAITSDIAAKLGIHVPVYTHIQNDHAESGKYLNFVPNKGSIQVKDSAGKVIGWDNNGNLEVFDGSASYSIPGISILGFVSDGDKVGLCKVDGVDYLAHMLLDFPGLKFENYSFGSAFCIDDNFYMIDSTGKVQVYPNELIAHNPELGSVSGREVVNFTVEPGHYPFYINNVCCAVYADGDGTNLKWYQPGTSQSFFSRNIYIRPLDSTQTSIAAKDGIVYVFSVFPGIGTAGIIKLSNVEDIAFASSFYSFTYQDYQFLTLQSCNGKFAAVYSKSGKPGVLVFSSFKMENQELKPADIIYDAYKTDGPTVSQMTPAKVSFNDDCCQFSVLSSGVWNQYTINASKAENNVIASENIIDINTVSHYQDVKKVGFVSYTNGRVYWDSKHYVLEYDSIQGNDTNPETYLALWTPDPVIFK